MCLCSHLTELPPSSQLNITLPIDADDGLEHTFVKNLQFEAHHWLKYGSGNSFRIWCLFESMEWQGDGDYLKFYRGGSCLTPGKAWKYKNSWHLPETFISHFPTAPFLLSGLTYGYAANVSSIPFVDHWQVHTKYGLCGRKEKDCVNNLKDYYKGEELGSLRARTPTSTGMQFILTGNATGKELTKQASRWRQMENNFSIIHRVVKSTQKKLKENMVAIAAENLAGQCTPGHSCKNSTQSQLRSIKEKVN